MARGFLKEVGAIATAVSVFAILHIALTGLSNEWARNPADFERLLPWINIMAYLLYVIAGFISAAMAKRYQIINGAVAGFLAATLAVVVFGVALGDAFGKAIVLAFGILFGGVGGVCSLFANRKAKDAL